MAKMISNYLLLPSLHLRRSEIIHQKYKTNIVKTFYTSVQIGVIIGGSKVGVL